MASSPSAAVTQICCLYSLILLLVLFRFSVAAEHGTSPADLHHHCNHGHDHDHDHDNHHHHHHYHAHDDVAEKRRMLLPEELAEEEDLKLYGFGGGNGNGDGAHHHHHHHDHDHLTHEPLELSGLGLWIHAMSCSLLVSLASLICLILLPLIFIQGKPTKGLVDSLALFGAGAMLGDAFLHQLPHAFGGEHSHSHDSHMDDAHDHSSHSHSLKDLSVGLSVLAGIVLFLLVEKLVRYVEDVSGGENAWSHAHHHHHKHSRNQNADNDSDGNDQGLSQIEKDSNSVEPSSDGKQLDRASDDASSGVKQGEPTALRKRNTGTDGLKDKSDLDAPSSVISTVNSIKEIPAKSHSNLVFGYLNLFSDGVHNFTDGMALGSAFLLYGSIGGWSRTLFLLAHELPQEIGDFGILVRSGFSVSKALCFNFLSALVALAGTALALMLGQDPGQSSLIEGFTAGGFIYIAVAGVLAEMNNGSTSLRNTAIQLISLMLGMSVALGISLV